MKKIWKKIVAYLGLGTIFLAVTLLPGIRIWIGHSMRENIATDCH